MKFDSYNLKARIVPAFFSIILPIMVFNYFYTSQEFANFVGKVLGAKLISNLTISAICLFFLSEFGRIISKNVFERIYFCEELKMPTTNLMLFSNKTYSEEHKKRFREKVKNDFNIILPNAIDEIADENLVRTKIVEAMALVRKKLKGNKFLLQHNIEYGAMRNAIGGAVLGVLISIFNIIFFSKVVPVQLATNISLFLTLTYTLLIMLSKIIIDFYGLNYAKILFREYLGAPRRKLV